MSFLECQTDRHKRIFLQGAIKGRDWAFFVLCNSCATDMTYKDLVNQLGNAQQQSMADKSGALSTQNLKFRTLRWKSNLDATNVSGQRRVGREPLRNRNITLCAGYLSRIQNRYSYQYHPRHNQNVKYVRSMSQLPEERIWIVQIFATVGYWQDNCQSPTVSNSKAWEHLCQH